MRSLIKKVAVKVILVALLVFAITSIYNLFYPVINNQMALTQFENDDFAFVALTMWQNLGRTLSTFQLIAMGLLSISVCKDVIVFCNRKEKE